MAEDAASVPVTISFLGPDDVMPSQPHLSDVFRVQGFSGEVGQRAISTAPTVEIYCGLGREPTRKVLREAISAIGIAPGSSVRIVAPSREAKEGRLLVAAEAEFAAAGFVVEHVDGDVPDFVPSRPQAEALARAREWTNAPGATLTPVDFADMASHLACDVGLSVDVWDRSRLEDERCGAILAVGQGSIHEPRLLDISFSPVGAQAHVTLIGKGITFDTGGLSLKSPAAMASMRMDKVGAATVLAVLSVLPQLALPIAVRGLLPLAENMIGSRAVRPGDVVTGRSGIPITIVDTDFEGRVLMSDAITLACEAKTDCIIDIAALTYQVAVALGNDIGGLFSNNERLAADVLNAAESAGEPLWQLPLARQYMSQVRMGDGVKNHPESDVGRAITAALFLEHFVTPGMPWAHLDVSGPAWSGPASGPGSTGFAVATLLEFLSARAASA